MKKYIYIFVLLFPVWPYLLNVVDESNGLIWIALDTAYYYPVFLLASSLFTEVEMGLLIPSVGGRILTFVLYATFLIVAFKLYNKLRRNQ
jgi:ABC-type Na+ efflux pump permease subunit